MACLPGYTTSMVMRDGQERTGAGRRKGAAPGVSDPRMALAGAENNPLEAGLRLTELKLSPLDAGRGLPPAAARALLRECQGSLRAALGE